MQITITDEYRSSEGLTKIYLSRWRDHSLLLMNQAGRDLLVAKLDELDDENAQELARIVRMGVIEAETHNGAFELPEALEDWLGGNSVALEFKKSNFGLIIFHIK